MLHTDTQLLTLLKDDSEEGLAALIGEYSGFLWAVSGRYLDNGEDIKDCLNETFSDFYLHLDRFDPDKGSLKGYLAVICQRNALRRGRDNLRWAGVQPSELKADSEPLERWEQTETLDEALSSLDPVDEQIVRMKYYGGMTAREIAASLGLPRETVYKRQQRSLSKMKKFLIATLFWLCWARWRPVPMWCCGISALCRAMASTPTKPPHSPSWRRVSLPGTASAPSNWKRPC